MKKVIKITESHLNRIITNMLTEENILINEDVSLLGVKIIPVPNIGKIKIVKDKKEIFYKLSVDHWLYSGPIVVDKLWENVKDGDYKVVDNTGKKFSVSKKDMEEIINNSLKEIKKFTIYGKAKITFEKTS
jgi:hypothetical protein